MASWNGTEQNEWINNNVNERNALWVFILLYRRSLSHHYRFLLFLRYINIMMFCPFRTHMLTSVECKRSECFNLNENALFAVYTVMNVNVTQWIKTYTVVRHKIYFLVLICNCVGLKCNAILLHRRLLIV